MRGLSSGIGVLHRTYKYSVKGRYLGGIALYALCYEYQNRGGPSRRWTWKKRGIACGQDDVHTLCEALEIPRGTLCNHILRNKRANAQFEKRREEYRLLICEVFAEYRQVLGAEKIWMILARRGHQVGAKFGADLVFFSDRPYFLPPHSPVVKLSFFLVPSIRTRYDSSSRLGHDRGIPGLKLSQISYNLKEIFYFL